MDKLTQERIAENDATFRDANERIRAAAVDYGVETAVPFICECADPKCVEIVRLVVDDYERVRGNPRWFVNAPGHDRAAGPAACVVSSHDGWVLVEKVGHAGNVAEELAGGADAVAAEGGR
jgi:hypothetical protein